MKGTCEFSVHSRFVRGRKPCRRRRTLAGFALPFLPMGHRVFFEQIAWITRRMPVMVAPEGIRLAMCIVTEIRKAREITTCLYHSITFGAGFKGQKF